MERPDIDNAKFIILKAWSYISLFYTFVLFYNFIYLFTLLE